MGSSNKDPGALDLDLLVAVSSDIGGFVEKRGVRRYQKSDDCVGCLKDLQRFLRLDDPDTRPVFFKLASFQTASSQLVPLITAYSGDRDLVFNALKVLTFLTMPVDMTSADIERQLQHQRSIKASFTKPEAVVVIVSLVAEPLSKHPRMSQQDSATVQLVMTFFRNLLELKDEERQPGCAHGNAFQDLQAKFLTTLFEENVMELFLHVTQRAAERPFRNELPLLLGLCASVVSAAGPHELTQARLQPIQQQREAGAAPALPKKSAECSLGELMLVEALRLKKQRVAQALAQGPRLHSRARACFMRTYKDSAERSTYLGSRFDKAELQAAAPPPMTSVIKDGDAHALVSSLPADLLWRLRCWAEELLKGGYNALMQTARKELEPGLGISRLEAPDFINFIKVASFMTSFVRMKQEASAAPVPTAEAGQLPADLPSSSSPFASVSATMGWETFHLVHMLWLGQLDVPAKSDLKDWALQHCSMTLLKEMLLVLELAQRVGSPDDKKAADHLQRRLLHDDMKDSGLLPVLGRIMREFNPKKQPRSHAADVLQATHVVLRLYDRLSKNEPGGFLVKRKAGRAGKRKKQKQQEDVEGEDGNVDAAAADLDGGEKPDSGEGAADAGGEKSGGEGSGENASEKEKTAAAVTGRDRAPLEELYSGDSSDGGDEEDEEGGSKRFREVALDLSASMRRELATPAVVHFVVQYGLRHYANNSAATNAATCAVLTRIAAPQDVGGLGLEPMLYQLSVLRVMHALLVDRSIRTKGRIEAFQDLLKLATKVVRGLFAKLVPPAASGSGGNDAAAAAAGPAEAAGTATDVPGGDAEDEDQARAAVVAADVQEKKQKKEAKQAEIQDAVSGMLFVDLMFWKTTTVVDEINGDYFVRLYEESGLPAPSRRRKGAAADLGDDEEGGGGLPEEAAGEALPAAANAAKRLAEAKDQLRRMHQKQSRPGQTGLLNPEGREKLQDLFERNNCSRANMDVLLAGMDGGLRESQVTRELKTMGLKWGQLTTRQVEKLKQLWSKYQLNADYTMLIAAGMTGGWTSKQVGGLLRKHGLVASHRRGAGGSEDDDEEEDEEEEVDWGAESGGEGAEEEGADGLEEVEDKDLQEIWERLGGRPETLEKVCEELAVVCDLSAPPPQRLVLRRLRKLGLLRQGKVGRKADKAHMAKKRKRDKAASVSASLLKELYEEFREYPDVLNQITSRLPGQISVKQVQKLLQKHGVTDSGAVGGKTGRKARMAAEREQLAAAMLKHAGKSDMLDLIAEELPGVVTVKLVQRMLKKHGLLESKTKKKGRDGGKPSHRGSNQDAEAAGSDRQTKVPEPDAHKVLENLRAIQLAYLSGGRRWMCAERAAAWVLTKLDAAERLWEITNPPHVDYSLAMNGDEDEDFFMTEHSQELLEAVGCRNDADDFFKIPGNSSASWRQRVRATVQQALEQLKEKGSLEDYVAVSRAARDVRPSTQEPAAATTTAEADVEEASPAIEDPPSAIGMGPAESLSEGALGELEDGGNSSEDEELSGDDGSSGDESDSGGSDSDEEEAGSQDADADEDAERSRLPMYHSGDGSDDEQASEGVGQYSEDYRTAARGKRGGSGGSDGQRPVAPAARLKRAKTTAADRTGSGAGGKGTRRAVAEEPEAERDSEAEGDGTASSDGDDSEPDRPRKGGKRRGKHLEGGSGSEEEAEEQGRKASAKRSALQELARRRNKSAAATAPASGALKVGRSRLAGQDGDGPEEDVDVAMEGIKRRRMQAVSQAVGKENAIGAEEEEDMVDLDDF